MTLSGQQILGRDYPTMHGPVINMNGSSPERLVEDMLVVIHAASDLVAALRAATPHGRDYQTVRPEVASDTHDRMVLEGMIADVRNIRNQFERIAERIALDHIKR